LTWVKQQIIPHLLRRRLPFYDPQSLCSAISAVSTIWREKKCATNFSLATPRRCPNLNSLIRLRRPLGTRTVESVPANRREE